MALDVDESGAELGTSGGSASGPASSEKGSYCELVSGARFTLSPPEGAASAEPQAAQAALNESDPNEEQLNAGLPYAVELGTAIAYRSGFAVAALRGNAGHVAATLLLLPPTLGSGTLVDLGRVHGDNAPPRLARALDSIIVLVPDADAAGGELKLVKVEVPPLEDAVGAPKLSWGASVHNGDDESEAVDLAVLGEDGLLVWDDWDKAKNLGVLRASHFRTSALDSLSAPSLVSDAKLDAESPRIVSREGGFWLAYAVNDEVATVSRPGPLDSEDHERTLAPTKRGVFCVPLNREGKPLNVAQRVTPPGAVIADFDLGIGPDGSAWVSWVGGGPVRGVDGGELGLSVVSLSGLIEHKRLDADELGAGTPLLFSGAERAIAAGATTEARVSWLAAPSGRDGVRLAKLDPNGGLRGEFVDEVSLRQATPLVQHGARFLLATPERRSVVFSLADCR